MDNKYLGRDGFGEIETIFDSKKIKNVRSRRRASTAKKTVRFIKRAASECKKSLGKKSSAAQLKVLKTPNVPSRVDMRSFDGEFNSSAREALTSVVSTNSRRYAHGAPRKGSLKKKAILATVASLTAISLTFATGVGALNMPVAVSKQESSTQATVAVETTAPVYEAAIETVVTPEVEIVRTLYGLYVDGELMGIAEDGEALSAALDQVLADYRKGYDEATTTEFANSVEVREIEVKNPETSDIEEIIKRSESKFSIALSTDMPYTTSIDYETEYEYDDTQPESYEKVKTEGKEGKIEVVVRTTYTDGVQTDAFVSETKVLEEPQNEVIVKGTKEEETVAVDDESKYDSDSSGSGIANGSFIWPLPYTHYITSNFEWRWGRMHNGIDISAGGVYGQPAIAADGGVVTHAGDDGGGYGIYVIVDHGNGYSTLYGHFSGLAVSVGDTVSQGDTVGYVGSTGNSTGPHLHFEVMINGEKQNPLNYVS